VRRLIPPPTAEVEPYDAYGDRTGDLVRITMVMSADGSVTDVTGWTDGLGGAADVRVFRALRALSDAILVGANTIRTGRVGPHRPPRDLQARRIAVGKPATAPIVVVSETLSLDWSHRLFTEAANPTQVVTSEDSLAARGVPADVRARMVTAGQHRVNLAEAVRRLRADFGLQHLLCEGGPQLATGLLDRGLVDELCLSIAPTLIGANHHTRLLGHLSTPIPLVLCGLYEEDGVTFLRYRLQ